MAYGLSPQAPAQADLLLAPASRPSAPRSQLPYIDYLEMVADTVPLADSRGFGRKGQRLDRVRQLGGSGQMSKGNG